MSSIPEGMMTDRERHMLARGTILLRLLNTRDFATRRALETQLAAFDRAAKPTHFMPVGGSARDLL